MKTGNLNALIIGAIAIMTLGVWFFNTQKKKSTVVEPQKINLPTNSNLLTRYQINNDKDTVLMATNGSKITINAHSFEDLNGKPVDGWVEINYREIKNPAQILLSGISMEYDSGGVKRDFESAGMFEIYGSAKGAPIKISAGKSLKVKMVSNNLDKDKFNQYYMDTITKKWSYIKKDDPRIKITISENPNYYGAKYLGYQFKIDINDNQFPELIGFKDLLFEVCPESKNFDPKTTEKNWNDIEIEIVKGTDKLLMTFSNDQEQNQVVAQIKNLDGKNLKKIYSAYLSRKEQMGERVNANARENRNAQVKDSTTIAENKGREETEATVYRTFSVLQFGIFNSDCVAMMPKGMIVKASFNKINGRNLEPIHLYLIDKNRNAAFTIYDKSQLSFNPKSINSLFAVFADNSVGYVKNEQFNAIPKGKAAVTFTWTIVKKESYEEKEIEEMLQ